MSEIILAKKHTGMRISADGCLGRISSGRAAKCHKVGAGDLLRHLHEMADRYYAGDAEVVDAFLQLYCLDDKRPTESHEDENTETEETLP